MPRKRSTKDEMGQFRSEIWQICEQYRPLSPRQVYYRAVVAGLIEKDQGKSRASEAKVGNALNWMRERGVDLGWSTAWQDWTEALWDVAREIDQDADVETWRLRVSHEAQILPFDWLTDSTRTRYQIEQYTDKRAALKSWTASYRRDRWPMQPRHVEVWCESESIGSTLIDLTYSMGLALLPCRGQAGKGFVYSSARAYAGLRKPVTCLYVGDFDPAGLDIGESLRERLERYGAPDVEFRRLAVIPGQVAAGSLPGHGLNPNIAAPVKSRFVDVCAEYGIPGEAVEAEAMPPDELRTLVEAAIWEYVDRRQWELDEVAEASEVADLRDMLEGGAA